jgi:excisionase family DNA binding protein
MPNNKPFHLEPIAVSPKQATELLPVGITRLYELINSGEIESQLIGRRRWINYQSLKRFAGLA